MKKIIGVLGLIFFFAGAVYFFKGEFLKKQLDQYAVRAAQEKFGAMPLAPELEEKIKVIACQMGVDEPIIIRKMNYNALRTFGYNNAFVYFYSLFNIIPISSQPFLFVSESFFEELSPEEQVFIIGHEIIHVKERHTLYLNFFFYLSYLMLFLLGLIFIKNIELIVPSFLKKKYQGSFTSFITCLLLVGLVLVPIFIKNGYRRHIEWVADSQSMEILQSHDGGLKLLERWQKKYNLSAHNNDFLGLFADHPSCYERTQYCLEYKKKTERKL